MPGNFIIFIFLGMAFVKLNRRLNKCTDLYASLSLQNKNVHEYCYWLFNVKQPVKHKITYPKDPLQFLIETGTKLQTFPWASTGESRWSSSLATFMLPYLAARCSGVKPFFVVAVRDAPCSRRTDATCNKIQLVSSLI